MKTIKRKSMELALREAYVEDVLALGETYEGEQHLPQVSDGRTFIVSVGKDDVALLSYVSRKTSVLVTQLFVYPEFRGYGLGTQILEILEGFDGVDQIDVIAAESSISFYKKLGFESCELDILMSKKVS